MPDVHRKVYLVPKYSRSFYTVWMKTIHNSLTFDTSDVAKYRLHVLIFFYKHGLKATMDAFSVKKSTLYDWKNRYEKSDKKLSSLVPISTCPHRTRDMHVDPELEIFIRTMRETYGTISKYKIKPFLDEYARSIGKHAYSTGKIGKIIKRRNYFFEGKKTIKRKKKPLTLRIRHAPKEKEPGYIEMDGITLYVVNKKHYFITAIDVVTKYAWCTLVPSLSSINAKSALITFHSNYQIRVRALQTDNGSEFLGAFHSYTKEQRIPHHFIYPRSPRINGVVERFNRTIQEEFIKRNDEIYYSIPSFNKKLTDYLTWYNHKRPHHALNLKPPITYMQQFM